MRPFAQTKPLAQSERVKNHYPMKAVFGSINLEMHNTLVPSLSPNFLMNAETIPHRAQIHGNPGHSR